MHSPPDPLTATMLNLDRNGHPHHKGTVVAAETGSYLVETDGSFRRVQILEQDKDGVRYRRIRALGKAEKKSLKRARQQARRQTEADAVRIARQVLESPCLT